MSVIIYQKKRPENQLLVEANEVVAYLMCGWNIAPYSAMKVA